MDEQILLPAEDKNLREPYREYFTTKKRNYLAVIGDVPELWNCFLTLDQIWARDLDNMRVVVEKERPPLIVMFRRSHQQFRIAFELGFSTALTEAFCIMRGAIDTAVVAHKIFREPHLLKVWAHKNDGKTEEKAYRLAFETNKAANLFPAQSGLAKLHSFYSDYSEWGTHPRVSMMALHTNIKQRADGQDWDHSYLETDPKRTVVFLFQMLQASALIEAACFDCFKDRLKLDAELMDMRQRFEKSKKETARIISNEILRA